MKFLLLLVFFIRFSGQKTSSFSILSTPTRTKRRAIISCPRNHHNLHLQLSIQQSPEDGRNKESQEEDDIMIDSSEPLKPSKTPTDLPPSSGQTKSRLALLAEDWLDDDEEDELQKYWERFDEKSPQPQQPTTSNTQDNDDSFSSSLTTEERLERYLDSRGIRRKEERLHQKEIEDAIQTAQKATTAEEAIQALEAVQPYLQVHTRLGGTALVEYLIATWQSDRTLDEELCRALLKNPHDIVASKVKQLLKRKEPPTRQPSLWSGVFSSKDDSSGWRW
jgi:hypothetical protein